MADPNAPTYKSLNTRAACAMFFLSACAVNCLLGIAEGTFTLWGVHARANNVQIPDGAAAVYDLAERWILFVVLPSYVGCVISFLMWFYRAHRNLNALGNDELEYKSGWTIWGFFIPFLNLVRPFQMMRETWHGSDPTLLGQSASFVQDGVQRGTPTLVGWWWGTFLAMGMLSRASKRLGRRIENLPNPSDADFQFYAWATLAGSVIAILAAILAVRLVWTITRMQTQRHELVIDRATQR